MLKTIRLLNKLVFSKNDSNKSAFEKNNSDGKVDGYDIDSNSIEHTKKLRKSKSKKMSKF